ncbi:MAG TPA: hypothetical protein VMU89_13575 [Thermomicrobiaceae bacterium]|nr:hypothetical protein [Thermomicrobiaceae bacterium]
MGQTVVTLIDRLAGIQRVDPYVEFTLTQYFDVEGTAINWRSHRLSPLARQLGASLFSPDRHVMVDRLYLGIMFYGTTLRRLTANSEAQLALFNRISSIGEALTRHDLDPDVLPHPRVEALGPTSTPIVHAIQVVLYSGRDGRLASREYPLRNAMGWWAAPLCVLGSLIDACDERERAFLGYWLQGLGEFYQRRGAPNSPATPRAAAESGLAFAVDQVIARICADRMRSPAAAAEVDDRIEEPRPPREASVDARPAGPARRRRPERIRRPDTG